MSRARDVTRRRCSCRPDAASFRSERCAFGLYRSAASTMATSSSAVPPLTPCPLRLGHAAAHGAETATRWIPTRSATPSTALVPQRKVGFPFRTPAFCSASGGRRRLGEKEYRAASVTPGVALRPRTQAAPAPKHIYKPESSLDDILFLSKSRDRPL